MYYTDYVNMLAAFSTPTVAAIAAYIAYKQHRIEKERLKLDLVKKREVVFNASREFIFEVIINYLVYTDDYQHKKSLQFIHTFRSKTQDVSFLFDSEVVEYVDLIYRNGLELRKINMTLKDNETSQEKRKLEEWFDSEVNTKNVYKKFEKYMRIYCPD